MSSVTVARGWAGEPSTGTTTGDYNVSGGQVGGTVGYNFQTGAWVLGVEGDVDWSSVKGSTACPNAAFTCSTENSWLSTVRGRLGYAAGPALFYVTGGGAFLRERRFSASMNTAKAIEP